ncbi:hypothetical protein [Stenotrophomonas sp.]|uniref:hypothetical protein n=1 Tax=Stenotrophomonas sp. TaxID=69392 RepID=UPI00289D9D3D|nr:hypothetical protein [Stenotrophomonas sp.]
MPHIGQSSPIATTPDNFRVERFSLGKATGSLSLNGIFNRSKAVPPCPVSGVVGVYQQYAYGCAMERAWGVMKESLADGAQPKLSPADARAVQRSMSWLAPKASQRFGNPVLRRLTALATMHAAVNKLLSAGSSNQTVLDCEAQLRQSIVDIAIASGKCERAPLGGDAGGPTALVAKHLTTAGERLLTCVRVLEPQTFSAAVVGTVLREPLREVVADRLVAQVEKWQAQGETSLEVMNVLNAEGAEKVRAAVQNLSWSNNPEAVQNAILDLLKIPELVTKGQAGSQESKGPDKDTAQPSVIPPDVQKLAKEGAPILYNNNTNDFSKLAEAIGGSGLNLESLGNLLDRAEEKGYRLGLVEAENNRLKGISEAQRNEIEQKNYLIDELNGRIGDLEERLVESTVRLSKWMNESKEQGGRDTELSRNMFEGSSGTVSNRQEIVHRGEPNVGHSRLVVHKEGVPGSVGTPKENHAAESTLHMNEEEVDVILESIPLASIGVLPESHATVSVVGKDDDAVVRSMPQTARAVSIRGSELVDSSEVQAVSGTHGTPNNEFSAYLRAVERVPEDGVLQKARVMRSNGNEVTSAADLPNPMLLASDVVRYLAERSGAHHSRSDAGTNVSGGAPHLVGSRNVKFLPIDIEVPELQQVYAEWKEARFSGVDSPLRSAVRAVRDEEYRKRLLNPSAQFAGTSTQRSDLSADQIHADLNRQLDVLLARAEDGSNVDQEATVPQQSITSQPTLNQGSSLGPMERESQVATTSNMPRTSSGTRTGRGQLPVIDLKGEYVELLDQTRPGGDLSDRHLVKAAVANALLFNAKRLGNAPPSDISAETVERRLWAAKSSWVNKADPNGNLENDPRFASFEEVPDERGDLNPRRAVSHLSNINREHRLGSAGQSVGDDDSSRGSDEDGAPPDFRKDSNLAQTIIGQFNRLKKTNSPLLKSGVVDA